MTRPPLAIFSPLPPTKSGIADYCFEQLPYFAKNWDITVVVHDRQSAPPKLPKGVRMIRRSKWRHIQPPADLVRLYHIGNNVYHEFVVNECLQHPGVIVLHDFVLHHLAVEMTLARGQKPEYAAWMERDHGEIGRIIADHRGKYHFSEYQQFLLPMNAGVLRASHGVITHSKWAKRRLEHAHPSLIVRHIPHHFSPPRAHALASSQIAARERIGMPVDRVIFASLGFVTRPKCVELAIAALGKLRPQLPPFEFWLVGEVRDRAHISKVVEQNNMTDLVKIMGYVGLDDFQLAIQGSDVIINLRYPTAGETSGTLTRALGMGKPCVIFDYASFADVPDAAAAKIPLCTRSTGRLEQMLFRLGTDVTLRRSIGDKAATYARETCSLDRCTQAYQELIAEVAAIRPPSLAGAVEPKPAAARSFAGAGMQEQP